MRTKKYSRCYFCWYKLKVTGCWPEGCDGTGADSWGQLSSCSTERPWGCCPASGSLLGCWQTAGNWSWHCVLSWLNVQVWTQPNSSPFSHLQWHTRSVGPVGRELSHIFLSCWVCLAVGVSSLWGDTEPLAEGLCKMCNLHHRRCPWKMVYVQTQWGLSSAAAYEE